MTIKTAKGGLWVGSTNVPTYDELSRSERDEDDPRPQKVDGGVDARIHSRQSKSTRAS